VPERAHHLPWSLLRSLAPMARGAIDNARRAAAEIERSVEERRTLMAGLEKSPDADVGVADAEAQAEAGVNEDPGERHLVVLTTAECRRLLAARRLGRLAFVNRDQQPLIVPVNYSLDGKDILIRTGPGPKLQAAVRGDVVAFEVDDIDESTGTGWSVVVTGRTRTTAPSAPGLDRRRHTTEPQPWAPGPRSALIRLSPDRITGRWLAGPRLTS
jgi:uncharacterized protein